MVDIVTELSENKIILVLIPSNEYNEMTIDITKELAKKNICYVTLNKTFPSLTENFKKKGINTDNVVFIDAISKTIKSVPNQTDKCYYISSPNSLTELSIAVTKFLKHNFDYLIFDSLTNLLIYSKKAPVAQFLSNLINKIRTSDTKAVFFALSLKDHDELIKEAGMFVDKVIDLSKINK